MGWGTIIIAKSMHLFSFGKLVWGEGALESFQNQCMLCGFGKLIGGQGTRIIAKSMHLYGFGRLVGGRGTRIIATLMHLYGVGRLVGGAWHQNPDKIETFI